MLHYQAALVRDPDGSITARCLELGWLCAHGRTPDEALARLRDLVAMELSDRPIVTPCAWMPTCAPAAAWALTAIVWCSAGGDAAGVHAGAARPTPFGEDDRRAGRTAGQCRGYPAGPPPITSSSAMLTTSVAARLPRSPASHGQPVHAVAPARWRAFSLAALGFAVMYATICVATCALQFTFVRHQILAGRLAGLEPWVAASPNSVMFALDNLGFFLQGIATLFLAPLFGGRRISNAIRWLFVANGIGTIVLIVLTGIMSFGSASGQTLYRATTVAWAALLTTALLLVARAFRRRLLPAFHEAKAR